MKEILKYFYALLAIILFIGIGISIDFGLFATLITLAAFILYMYGVIKIFTDKNDKDDKNKI